MNSTSDALLDFGKRELKDGNGALSNVLKIDKSSVDRMVAEVRCTQTATGGTKIVLSVEGCNNLGATSETWEPIVSIPAVSTAQLQGGFITRIPIKSDTLYDGLRIKCDVTGTYTAGIISAELDTYVGK